MHFNIVSLFNNYPQEEFSVFYLNSILKKYNHNSSLIFLIRTKPKRYIYKLQILPTDEEVDRVIDKLKYLKSDMVGISVYYTFLQAAIKLTKEIQTRLKIPVIWGGLHPSIAPEECIQFTDLICFGEGEEVVVELAEKIEKGADFSQIENLWIKENNKIIRNDVRPLIQDLDCLPFPDFEDKDCHYICTDGVYNPESTKRVYNIIASRGCLLSCTYCSEGLIRKIYGKSFKYRTRSPKNVIAELKQIKKNKAVKIICFHDALFPVDTDWIEEFSYLYKKEISFPFNMRGYPTIIKKQHIDLLVEAGLNAVSVSLESGSERIRKEIFYRPGTNSEFVEMARLFSQFKGLRIVYNILVDNPFETTEDKQKSLNLLLNLTSTFFLYPLSLTFYPKIEITERALREGKITQYDLLLATRPWALAVILNRKRNKEEKFWISLILLVALYHRFHFFPKKIIYLISKIHPLRKSPELFFIIMYYIYKITLKISKFY